jgi:hypothetical protein
LDGGGEKAMAALPIFSFVISSMRSNPKNSVTQPRRAFQIAFRFASIDVQKAGKLLRLNRRTALLSSIDPHGVVFVVANGKEVIVQGHRGRGIAHAAVNGRGRTVRGGGDGGNVQAKNKSSADPAQTLHR